MYTLLIVSGKADKREALADTLKSVYAGKCRIVVAEDGESSIAMASSRSADVVLIDIELPDINGLEAVSVIWQALPACKFIVLSDADQFQYAQAAVAIGVHQFLVRPVPEHKLIACIDRAIGSIKAERIVEPQRVPLDALAREQRLFSVISGFGNARSLQNKLAEPSASKPYGMVFLVRTQHPMRADAVYSFARQCYVAKRGIQSIYYAFEDLLILTLFSKEYNDFANVGSWTRDIVNAAKERYGLSVFIGIGDIVMDPTHLTESYILANEALLRCSYLAPIQSSDTPGAYHRLEKRLTRLLLERNLDEAIRCMDTALDTLYCGLQHPGSVSFTLRRMFLHVAKLLEQVTQVPYDLSAKLSSLSKACLSAQELSVFIRNLLSGWIEDIDGGYDGRIQRTRREIERYIHERYMDENLSVTKIANDLHYSEQYFSRLFARCFQCTFVTYLTELRVQLAQDLLRDSSLSIRKVCSAVGYGDANYFAKVFKKACGISPSDYRRRYIGGEGEAS